MINLKLTSVVTYITGDTGMRIIRAIVAGQRNLVQLAQYRGHRCKKTTTEIALALDGNYQPERPFMLYQSLEFYDYYTQQLAVCDSELKKQYAVFAPLVDILTSPLPLSNSQTRQRKKGNHPANDLRTYLYQMFGVDRTADIGLDVLLVQSIVSEAGIDKWPTDKHFTASLAPAPNNKSSAGKVKSRKTPPTQNRASTAFRLAAQSVARTQSARGAFYRRIKAKHGAPKAITATTRKLAIIVYYMLKDRQPYHDPGIHVYEERCQGRQLRGLHRQAKRFGLCLVPDSLPAVS